MGSQRDSRFHDRFLDQLVRVFERDQPNGKRAQLRDRAESFEEPLLGRRPRRHRELVRGSLPWIMKRSRLRALMPTATTASCLQR